MKKLFSLILLLALSINIIACGRDTEPILAFQNKLNTVVRKMEVLNAELNALDVSASDAAENALDSLAELNTAFKELASITVTDEDHMYITDLADEGAKYMSHAYELFKKAYSNNNFDKSNAELAYQYLERATKRVRVIVNMLHGNIPDDVTVH